MSKSVSGRIVFLVIALGSMIMLSLGATCGSIDVQENFIVAYVTTPNRIVIRSAPVNAIDSWHDGQFPGDIPAGQGIGLAVDKAGVLHIALTDSTNEILMTWGLGPSTWDSRAGAAPAAPPDSSPVGVHLGGDRWAIAFCRADETLFVGVYDHSERAFIGDFAPFGELNSEVEGRPSIAISGDNLILAWRRWDGDRYDLVVARATVQQAVLNFDSPQEISIAAGSGLIGGVWSDPVVTRAGNSFYLAVVREQEGNGLHGWRTQLFSSADGQAWSSVGITATLDVSNATYLGLGGASDGRLLGAAVRRLSGGNSDVSAAIYANGGWQSLSGDVISSIFDGTVVYKPFVVVGSMP